MTDYDTLQTLILGDVLGTPERLQALDPDQFGVDLGIVVRALQDRNTEPLREWLLRRGVRWTEGRALDAIRRELGLLAGRRDRRARTRAIAVLAGSGDEGLRALLRELVADSNHGGNSNAGAVTETR